MPEQVSPQVGRWTVCRRMVLADNEIHLEGWEPFAIDNGWLYMRRRNNVEV